MRCVRVSGFCPVGTVNIFIIDTRRAAFSTLFPLSSPDGVTCLLGGKGRRSLLFSCLFYLLRLLNTDDYWPSFRLTCESTHSYCVNSAADIIVEYCCANSMSGESRRKSHVS